MPKSRQPEYKTAGYLIPDVLDPDECICVCVPVPNDERHIQAFKAQLFALSRWWTWERDDLKRGKEAAAVWAGIYECVEWRMDNNCGCGGSGESLPLQYRYTPEGKLEVSKDGGITWEDGSAYDERNQVPVYPPASPLPADSSCLYAENITDEVKKQVELIINSIENGGTVASAAAALLPLLVAIGLPAAPLAAFLILVYGLISVIISLVAGGLSNSFTQAFWDEFKCMWFCVIAENGEVTESEIEQVKEKVADYFGAPNPLAIKTIQDIISMLGANALTNAARMGDSILTGDCVDCECDPVWCYEFDFLLSDGDFEILWPEGSGQYTGGVWQSSDWVKSGSPASGNRSVEIKRTFASATITKIVTTYDYVGGTFDTTSASAFVLAIGGTNVIVTPRSGMVDGSGQAKTWNGSITATEMSVGVRSSRDITSPYSYSGAASIRKVRLEGTGTNPFGADNCP